MAIKRKPAAGGAEAHQRTKKASLADASQCAMITDLLKHSAGDDVIV